MKKQNAAAKRNPLQRVVRRSAKVTIRQLPTGVRGLDEILGGGLPELSFNIIAGTPGCGKTTLAHQIAFANATPKKPALYFTVLGEPAIKMLRHQQQFSGSFNLLVSEVLAVPPLLCVLHQQAQGR